MPLQVDPKTGTVKLALKPAVEKPTEKPVAKTEDIVPPPSPKKKGK